jgi:osmoprotectant transport system permease protein
MFPFLAEVVGWLTDPQNWQGPDGIPVRLAQHIGLSAVSLLLSCLVALPLGIWLGYTGRGGNLAINISNIGRAVPTFAVLSLLALGPLGLSDASTVLALVLFGIPPILTNTYVGMREVDKDVVEAARGMGMGPRDLVPRVQIPLAAPMLMAGIRLSAVQIVATVTIAAMVAGGGLGRIITSGFARQDNVQVVAGAILVALLALLVELGFEALQRGVNPQRSSQSDDEGGAEVDEGADPERVAADPRRTAS